MGNYAVRTAKVIESMHVCCYIATQSAARTHKTGVQIGYDGIFAESSTDERVSETAHFE